MSTIGSAIQQSPVISESIDRIVAEVVRHTSAITGAKGPTIEGSDYEETMARYGEMRGRPFLYPYLSSGAGRGPFVELGDGSIKWDLICGIGVHFMGHSHPELIREAITAGLEDTPKHGNLQTGDAPYEFTGKLLELAGRGSNLKHCFLSTSGVMANENALKVCLQKHAPASRVVAFSHCFMGRTITMSQIGDNAAARVGIPLSTQVDYIPFYTDEEVAIAGGHTKFIDKSCALLAEYIHRYPKQHACLIMELVQGEGGLHPGRKDFFTALIEVAKGGDLAIWDDEIQSFGRTTEMFAYDTYGIGEHVDVFCVGKMTQACATLFTADYNPKPGLLSGTFSGTNADFRVGQKILETLDEGKFYGDEGMFAKHHAEFRKHVDALATKHPEWFPEVPHNPIANGVGGMMRMTPFAGEKSKIIAAAKAIYEAGAVLFWCGHGPYHLRMLPPLPAMKLSDWGDVFAIIEEGLSKAA